MLYNESYCAIAAIHVFLRITALTLIMVIIKLAGVTSWSWWRALLPIGIFVGFNVMYIAVGFIYLTWARIPERADGDEAAILAPLGSALAGRLYQFYLN